MYRAGDTGRSDGFNAQRMFAKPKVAKNVFGRRIGSVMRRQAQSAAAARGIAPALVPVPGECQDWRCAGIREYRRLTSHAGCVDLDPAIFPPTKRSCTIQDWDPPGFSERQVRNGGEVLLCGAELAIAVRLRNQRAGEAIMAVAGTRCAFSFWDLLD